MKEFPQKEWEWSRISLDPVIQKLMLMVRLTVILVAVILNTPEQLTTSPFVQDLNCSQNDKVIHPDPLILPIVVHFNYVKFAADNWL